MSQIKVASSGYFNFRIKTSGRRPDPVEIRTPQSEDPRLGVNAFSRLRSVLEAVERWAENKDRVVCSVNRVAAGADPLVVPEQAVAEGAVWFQSETASQLYDRLSRVALEAGASSTAMFGLRSNPARIPTDHPLVVATKSAITAETGIIPGLYPAHVASDIRFPIRCLGVPAVGFGCLGGNFYGPNEWVNADDLHRSTRVLVRMVSAWADRATRSRFQPFHHK
ncbi:MAG: M20/M25/M40 family metallo-hydrolase [Acidimicrobiia bacterium]|nr:M20/M25/M40 family metallo-hydrolase [Acidimicrobiia bacterium]